MNKLEWIKAFDLDELQTFINEVIEVTKNQNISNDEKYIQITDIIHEWQESAIVISSGNIFEDLKSNIVD